MTDIAIEWGEHGGDIAINVGDLAIDEGLETAVLVSLFSEARAPDPSDLAGGEIRGWWPDSEADRHGSKLWVLLQEKITQQTLVAAKAWTETALGWLVEDEIASELDVEVTRVETYTVRIRVTITRGSAKRWQHLWIAQEKKVVKAPGVEFHMDFA